MHKAIMNPQDAHGSGEIGYQERGQEILARVKEVAQQITERVRKVQTDTEPHGVLPTDPTDESPAV